MPDKKDQKLFSETIVPAKAGSGRLFEVSYDARGGGAVECLGMTFANDGERRAYFLERLREMLQDPDFRKIEGFPIGSDEDIIALSDPPYYTACPNPFLRDFIAHYGRPYDPDRPYSRRPFSFDVKEGRHEPVYLAHTYHAKVPYRAVLKYILAYTSPGDIVYDGFAGSGMTGVACRSAVTPPADLVASISAQIPEVEYGTRYAVLSDISPLAAFLAGAYNIHGAEREFVGEARKVLEEAREATGSFYLTKGKNGEGLEVKYFVWSDVFVCPDCSTEISYAEHAYKPEQKKFSDEFLCPKCSAALSKSRLDRAFETVLDPVLGKPVRRIRQVLYLKSYETSQGRRVKEAPSDADVELVTDISRMPVEIDVPCQELPYMHMTHERNNLPALGVTHIHHFFTYRNLFTISALVRAAMKRAQPIRRMLLFWITSCLPKMSRLMSYNADGIGRVTKGIFYFSSVSQEMSPFHILDRAVTDISRCLKVLDPISGPALVHTVGAQDSGLPENSIDYIFTDPPFGENIYYSDLNYLWESWLKVFTCREPEAIVSRVDGKDVAAYEMLMRDCFVEYHRVLKPGRWITVEFHNSKNTIWNAIQQALNLAGFVVADVRVLDKKLGTFKQIVTSSTVKQDLIISAYKPDGGLEGRFEHEAGTETGAWDFVRTHIRQLPVFVAKGGQAEVIAERQNYLLFDRMVAFHVQRGVPVPLSAGDFYAGLAQRFAERDGMYFLSDQVVEYDRKRMTATELKQLDLFVTDESSAIQWLRQQLTIKPQTFQELHSQFLREIGGWEKHEEALELSVLLEENFLRYDGREAVPGPIHSYLSTTFKELRNLAKDDPALRQKGKDRWYVPDPNKAGDLEKLRERGLLREFEQYKQRKKKFGRNERFRMEAVRAGFKKAWQDRDYGTIIGVAELIPESILQEDPKLLMWYDQAVTRMGGE
ncbi:MAG: DNA methylase [Lentisphaerae bacterium]|jgi:hypothetical protein|nr:DNA methylase [Lentisphaerota bacterium]